MKALLIALTIGSMGFTAGYYKARQDQQVAAANATPRPTPKARDNSWIYNPRRSPLDEPARKVGHK